MADIALSSRTTTTTIAGGYVYIIIPDGGSPTGFTDRRISITDLLATIQADIDLNSAYITALTTTVTGLSQLLTKEYSEAKAASFTLSQPADSKITSFNFKKIADSPVISVGTTEFGEELISEREIYDYYFSNQILYTETARTIYITVTDGTIDLTTLLELNLFTNT